MSKNVRYRAQKNQVTSVKTTARLNSSSIMLVTQKKVNN